MTRLQSELRRLYLPLSPTRADDDAQPSALVDASMRVRALVFELARPPSWELLSRVWQGVQAELALPAPAIAVSGTDGLQLWFSLAEPVERLRANAFLDLLRLRFLPEVEADRVRLMPSSDSPAQRPQPHALPVPALQATGNWSAFVAPDLAAVFADTPWLDVAPNEEGQAALLHGLHVTEPAAFEAAGKRLGLGAVPAPPAEATAGASHVSAQMTTAPAEQDPRRFLLRVMNDDTVSLTLRIDAAKALLQ